MAGFKFLADVHIPQAAIEALQCKGIDIIRSLDAGFAQNEEDAALLAYATVEKRIMITCDYDFEQLGLAWQNQTKSHASILYFNMATGDCRNIGLIVEWVELVNGTANLEQELFNQIWRAK